MATFNRNKELDLTSVAGVQRAYYTRRNNAEFIKEQRKQKRRNAIKEITGSILFAICIWAMVIVTLWVGGVF